MLKNKKQKYIIVAAIILITLLEIYFGYKVFVDYVGVYQVVIFMPFVLQPFVYQALFIKEKSFYKLRIGIVVLISIIWPIMIYFTLPNYTYDKGKVMVEQYLGQNKNISFNDYSLSKKSIPTVNNPKQLFVSDRVYYYEITSEDSNKSFFIIDPLTGELKQLSQSYWSK